VRLTVLNVGVAGLAIGLPLGLNPLVTGGAALAALGLGVNAVLLGAAVWMGVQRPRISRR
jgi:hypothetical protein